MLRTDKPIYKILLGVNAVLILVGLALSVFNIYNVTDNATRLLMNIFFVIAILFAVVYTIFGYRKNAARFFRLYGGALAAALIVTIINICKNTDEILLPLFCSLTLTIVIAIVFGENFGKTKSFVYCGILIALALISLGVTLTKHDIYSVIATVILLDLTCLLGSMTYAKYLDKAERGTT